MSELYCLPEWFSVVSINVGILRVVVVLFEIKRSNLHYCCRDIFGACLFSFRLTLSSTLFHVLLLLLLPCPARMPDRGSVASSSIFSRIERFHPPTRTSSMTDVVYPLHSCPCISRFHLHQLFQLIFVIHPNMSIPTHSRLPPCHCGV